MKMPKKPKRRNFSEKQQPGRVRFACALLVLLTALIFPGKTSAQPDYPFRSGEYARYGAYYNWHFIWIQSGEVEFFADTTSFRNQTAWQLKAIGKTFKAYDLLFTVRDTFLSYCSYNEFKMIDSRRAINHGQNHSTHQYWQDTRSAKINVKITAGNKPTYSGIIEYEPGMYDLLATAYSFRRFNFDKLFVGEKVPYRTIIDKKVDDLFFRYLGKEKIKTRAGQEFLCHKVSVYLLQGDFFPEGEYMKIWFTDDRNHLPVQVETEIAVGSVKAVLLDARHLKYPLKK